ncbi:unnamed protein product [Periconia digitata]|uniref:Uncharacterized protein n=1 Tax=Periconia digitata TaxID=1303443 RepID=A0A9W4UK80_9PLEO|nr:unnamed protein product [Periconia digitata]
MFLWSYVGRDSRPGRSSCEKQSQRTVQKCGLRFFSHLQRVYIGPLCSQSAQTVKDRVSRRSESEAACAFPLIYGECT